MGIKLLNFRSCCFCLPLRTGLLTLGYINLVYHGLLAILAVFVAFWITVLSLGMGGQFPPLELSLLLPFVTISEVIFNVLIIIASHMKDRRLLKITFVIGAALWTFTVLYSSCITYRLGRLLHSGDYHSDDRLKFAIYITVVILEPIILGYVLLLARSLKIQLQTETRGLEYIDLETNRETRADYERLLPTIQ